MVAVAHTESLIHSSNDDDVENLDLKTSFGGLVPVVAASKKLNRYHQHIELAVDSDQTDSIIRRQQQQHFESSSAASPPSSTRSPSSEDIYEDEDEEIIRVDQIDEESEQPIVKKEEEEEIEDLNTQLTPPASTEQEIKEEEEEEEDRLVMDEINGDLKIADDSLLTTTNENGLIQGQVNQSFFFLRFLFFCFRTKAEALLRVDML